MRRLFNQHASTTKLLGVQPVSLLGGAISNWGVAPYSTSSVLHFHQNGYSHQNQQQQSTQTQNQNYNPSRAPQQQHGGRQSSSNSSNHHQQYNRGDGRNESNHRHNKPHRHHNSNNNNAYGGRPQQPEQDYFFYSRHIKDMTPLGGSDALLQANTTYAALPKEDGDVSSTIGAVVTPYFVPLAMLVNTETMTVSEFVNGVMRNVDTTLLQEKIRRVAERDALAGRQLIPVVCLLRLFYKTRLSTEWVSLCQQLSSGAADAAAAAQTAQKSANDIDGEATVSTTTTSTSASTATPLTIPVPPGLGPKAASTQTLTTFENIQISTSIAIQHFMVDDFIPTEIQLSTDIRHLNDRTGYHRIGDIVVAVSRAERAGYLYEVMNNAHPEVAKEHHHQRYRAKQQQQQQQSADNNVNKAGGRQAPTTDGDTTQPASPPMYVSYVVTPEGLEGTSYGPLFSGED